ISLGTPGAMAEQAATAAADGYRLLKIKLTGEDDRLRVAGVRRGAPDARLIVDANESWGEVDILSEAEALAERSAERRVGKECVNPCRSRWALYPENKNT